MIFVNPDTINPDDAWLQRARELTVQLKQVPPEERAAFIETNRNATWGSPHIRAELGVPVGNKCWYSEVHLHGADPNVDHFRPKGRVREVDENLQDTYSNSSGYWWLAFEVRNFRLCSMHSNQRRVDTDTDGGKWDYFPVRGARTAEQTDWDMIVEDILPLDPCSNSDVSLLWFDPDGTPCIACRKNREPSDADKARVCATIWLYHLKKVEVHTVRSQHVEDIRTDLRKANTCYTLWARGSGSPDLREKQLFDTKVAEIKRKISDTAEFAGAKRCAVRASIADYPWIEEFDVI